MKKLIVLSLAVVGLSATVATAQASSFVMGVAIGRPCPPIVVPAIPIVAPPQVIGGICERPVIVRDFYRDVRVREDIRRDRLHRDRF